ncbi:MAG: ATP-binding protein, partial [Treponema sp.]|nr:ATP-binding protein [Treponema sp.]
GFSISLAGVLERIGQHPVKGDGYLMLVGADNEIVFHPNPEYAPSPDGVLRDLRHIGNGELMASHIADGVLFAELVDCYLGHSYFMATPLDIVGWTLVAIIPSDAARVPVFQYMSLIIVSISGLLLLLFAFIMFFVSQITKNMEEGHAAEGRLRLIFDNMPMATNIRDRKHTILHCNDETRKLFHLNDVQEYVDRFWELSPEFQPDGSLSREMVLELSMRAFDTGHLRFEWMHQRLNGKHIPCEITLTRVDFKGGDYLLVFIRDLTEFYESRRHEQEVNQRMRLMLDSTPMLIQYWDEDYNCIDCNQTALDFFGCSSVGEYKASLWDANRRETEAENVRIWDAHLAKIFEEGFDNFVYEEKIPNKGNQVAFLEIVGYRVSYNDNTVAITYANDVTQLQHSMQMMREAEERAQLMLDGTPVSCFLINRDFEAIDCNLETLNLLDFESKAEGIENFKEIFMQHQFERLKKHFDRALQIGAERFEWILQKPNEGSYIPCDIAFIRFTHKGEFVIAAYIFDLRVIKQMLNERQRMETAEENNRAKSRFLARMSHEIRTPITAVLGISEIQLQNPTLSTHVEEAFVKIHDSASILLQLVNDILDLSKIEAGKMSLIHNTYDVASLISDVVQLHLVYIGSKEIEFHVNVDEKLPTSLTGDELRIKQIVSNLLSNAIKYTVSGSVDMSLRYQKGTAEDDMMLVISIHDTGRGMSKEQLGDLYNEYTRFNEDNDRSVGTGLGMPIVYSLVQMMDAKIEVESQVDEGTTVTVSIPQKIANPKAIGTVVSKSLRHFETSERTAAKRFKFVPELMPYGRVLVVDDVEANLFVAKGLLMFYGLKIETCNSGQAAIEKVKKGEVYDIIFMDHMMPGMNGIEAMKVLRDIGYNHPIVALTANALIGQAEEFLSYGFDGFISKPIQTVHLNTILLKYIRDKQPPEVLEAARTASTGFKPGTGNIDIDGYMNRPDVTNKLRVDFAKSQKNVSAEISTAMEAGDIKTAYRLAHTLKGLAGLIRESTVVQLAAEAEHSFQKGEVPAADLLDALKNEVSSVLDRIEIPDPVAPSPDTVLDPAKTKALFDRLRDLIQIDSAECLELLGELARIPNADELYRQIEEFDFTAAAKTLETLRADLKI